MKLSLSLVELEAGMRIRRIGAKALAEIKEHLATVSKAIPINPLGMGPNKVSLVWVCEVAPMPDKQTKISVRPIPQVAFQVLAMPANELQALTVQFGSEQWTFTRHGAQRTNHRTSGPGCDLEVRPSPQALLSKLIREQPSHPVVRRCLQYIKTRMEAPLA